MQDTSDSATDTSSSDFCEDNIDGELYGFSCERFRTSLVRPYLYEPEYTEEELQALENDQAEDDRLACLKENTNWYCCLYGYRFIVAIFLTA